MRYDPIADLLALNEPDPKLQANARLAGQIFALIGLAMALTVSGSWLLNTPILRHELPSLTAAHAISSAFFIFLDLSVLTLYYRKPTAWHTLLWALVFIANGIVILEYLTPEELPFAEYFRFLDPAENTSKISPNGALCMWALSLGAWLIAWGKDTWVRIGQACCLAAALVASLALIGHAYTIEALYGVGDYTALSVPGAIAYLTLAISILFVKPEKGVVRIVVTRSAAGVMTRRLYGPVFLLPPLLGLIALVSVEIWNWYDMPFGIALFAIACMLLLGAIVAATSVRLERIDLSRARAEEQLGRTITELEASRKQLRELSAHIQEVQEDERLRIARDLHDELGQSLTALKMDVALVRNSLPTAPDAASAPNNGTHSEPLLSLRRMDSMLSLVNSTIRSVQRISSELRPSLLDDLGLAAAIEWKAREFEERSGVAVSVDVDDVSLEHHRAIAIFRIFQETLTNIARHARAKNASVSLHHTNASLELLVRDDGMGFDSETPSSTPSLGLIGMRERAELAGGTLRLQSTPGRGTTVVLEIPLTESSNVTG